MLLHVDIEDDGRIIVILAFAFCRRPALASLFAPGPVWMAFTHPAQTSAEWAIRIYHSFSDAKLAAAMIRKQFIKTAIYVPIHRQQPVTMSVPQNGKGLHGGPFGGVKAAKAGSR